MPEAYSTDIRKRVIARVEGGASRREAAELFDISPSAALKWVKCFHETGSCVAKPRGGSASPLEIGVVSRSSPRPRRSCEQNAVPGIAQTGRGGADPGCFGRPTDGANARKEGDRAFHGLRARCRQGNAPSRMPAAPQERAAPNGKSSRMAAAR
jgi:hypothetical protein